MNELIEFLTSKEIIVVYIVAAVACLLCYIIYLIDKNYYKRKQKHNTKELKRLVEDVNEKLEETYDNKTVEVYETPILEKIEPIQEEVYTAKTQTLPEIIVEPTIIEPVQSQLVDPQEEIIESLEIEELETLNVENIVLETMEDETATETNKPEEELTYTTVEPNRQQAQEELMRLTEELEKAEQEAKNIDLTAYEEEQEENAIISLEELVKKSKELYESNEYTQYEDEGNEPISIEDLERRMSKIQEEATTIKTEEVPVIVETMTIEQQPETNATQMVLDDFNTINISPEPSIMETPHVEEQKPLYQNTKKFERSPIISPIYGIERKETTTDIELENTANYDKLDEEIKKTNEFLMTLRELQKNLD